MHTPRLTTAVHQLIAGAIVLAAANGPLVAQTTSIPSQVEAAAYHWAPFVFVETQMTLSGSHTSFEENQLMRVDFDDFDASNNSANASLPNVYSAPGWSLFSHEAVVYYSAVETGDDFGNGYYFLTYYFYHARDGGAPPWDGGHQNDLEGVQLIIKKTTTSPYGYFVAALTEAHGGLIPWRSAGPQPFDPQPVGRNWGGVWYINDGRTSGVSREVFITASMTHGAYAPQDCDGSGTGYVGPDYNLGINYTLTQQGWGTYYYCPHGNDNNMIMYMPSLTIGGAGTWQPTDANGGGGTYRLIELYNSSLWQYKTQDRKLLTGNMLSLWGGESGLDVMWATDTPGANPPWQWQGKQDCKVGVCWYTFGEDGNYTYGEEGGSTLPYTNYWGGFVTAPDKEAALRFSNIPQLNLAMRYNPYLLSPPDYSIGSQPPQQPLWADISGPNTVSAGASNTWLANVAGGTPPYSYQWYGALSGSDYSISGVLYNDDYLYLTVTDAAGSQVQVTLPITVCQDNQITC